jgi:hypothetical protein
LKFPTKKKKKKKKKKSKIAVNRTDTSTEILRGCRKRKRKREREIFFNFERVWILIFFNSLIETHKRDTHREPRRKDRKKEMMKCRKRRKKLINSHPFFLKNP